MYIYTHTNTQTYFDLTSSFYAQVPDGKFTLHLYQTEQLSEVVDDSLITTTFRIPEAQASAVPPRAEGISDFYYGTVCVYIYIYIYIFVCIYCKGYNLSLCLPPRA